MNSIQIKIKSMELAGLLIEKYGYNEVQIEGVEGFFLENVSANYPLIRINIHSFVDLDRYHLDYEEFLSAIKKHEEKFNVSDMKCLVIFFSDVVAQDSDNITNIVLKSNEDILENEIIKEEFPLIQEFFSIIQANNDNKNDGSKNQEKKITEMFSYSEFAKKTRYSRYFAGFLAFINVFVIISFLQSDMVEVFYDFSFYNLLAFQNHEYYRLLSGLLINNGLLNSFVLAYLLYRYSAFVEYKLGSKKYITFFVSGIIIVLFSMVFVTRGEVISGSLPLVGIMCGSAIALIASKQERNFLRINLMSFGLLLALFFLIWVMDSGIANHALTTISLVVGFAITYANVESGNLLMKRVATFTALSCLLIVGLGLYNGQTLSRSTNFEKNYIEYLKNNDEKKASSVQQTIDEYYEKKGVVNYDR